MKKTAGMIIRLSQSEYDRAKRHAVLIQNKSREDGRVPSGNMAEQYNDAEQLEKRIMGISAELAAANFLGVKWEEKVDVFHDETDIPGWDVRSVSNPKGDLIFRDGDPLTGNWILLLRVDDLTFRVLGWLEGERARELGTYKDYGFSNRPKVLAVEQGQLNKVFPE